jgi:hypothetical protein
MQQVGDNRFTRPIAQSFPENEQAQIKQDLDFYAGILQQANERGIMTESDYNRYKNYFSIAPLDTPESVSRRLKDFQSTLKNRMSTYLNVAEASKEDVSGLKQLIQQEVPATNDWAAREEQLFQEELARLKGGASGR